MVTIGELSAELFGQLVLLDQFMQFEDVRQNDDPKLEVLAEQLVRHLGNGLLQKAHRPEYVDDVNQAGKESLRNNATLLLPGANYDNYKIYVTPAVY